MPAFGLLNWLVVALYVAALLGVGFYYSRRQRTTEEYFVGNRNKRPFLAGIASFAAISSILSYIGFPGEWVQNGPVLSIVNIAALPFAYLAVGYLMIPLIMRLPITSAYELLEGRLGRPVRRLGSLTFIGTRLVWMSLILYTIAIVFVNVTGWDHRWIIAIEVAVGLITVAYTFSGGIEAVMLTSVIQFFILLAGALLTIGSISTRLGGVSAWWPRHWEPHWAPQPFFSLSPHVRVTVIGTLVSNVIFSICMSASDQVVVQRYLTTRNTRTARRSYLMSNIANAVFAVVLALVGAAVLGFYRLNPQDLPPGISPAKHGDALFPHYIAHYLPVGIAGLVVSSLLASAMSILGSSVNSIITVISKDFIDASPSKAGRTEADRVRTARLLTLGIGATIVVGSMGMGAVPGDLVEVTVKTIHLLICPTFGLFFLAMFVPFATPFGAVIGAIYSLTAAILVAYWDVITGLPGLSFQWITSVALVVSLAAGCGFSLLPTRGRSWKAIMACAAGAIGALGVGVFALLKHCSA